jgi:hypothetical protein
MFYWNYCVNYNVFHPRYQIFLNIYSMLWKFLIEVFLKYFKWNGVTDLMLTKSRFFKNLEAVVCQMDIKVFIIYVVFITWRSYVAFLKEVNIKILWRICYMNQSPHSDIEFTLSIKKRLLDVFLNNPLWVFGLIV